MTLPGRLIWLMMTLCLGLPCAATARPVQNRMVEQVLYLINVERERAGCGPLTLDERLIRAAQKHTEDMDRRNFFGHVNPDGLSPGGRVKAVGYAYTMVGENIIAGYATPEDAVQGWMNSPGHRANILTCAFTDTGIGFVYDPEDRPVKGAGAPYSYYWTQVFGKPLKP